MTRAGGGVCDNRVLVGGAHGFVYPNVVGGLIDHGALVRVIDNFLIAGELYLDGMDVEVSTGDVRDEDAAS